MIWIQIFVWSWTLTELMHQCLIKIFCHQTEITLKKHEWGQTNFAWWRCGKWENRGDLRAGLQGWVYVTGKKARAESVVASDTADEGTVQHLKILLETAGSTAISHRVCMGKSPGVRVTMTNQKVTSDQYVCEIGKQRKKRLEK